MSLDLTKEEIDVIQTMRMYDDANFLILKRKGAITQLETIERKYYDNQQKSIDITIQDVIEYHQK